MSDKAVLYAREGEVAIVTLNRPAALNALNEALLEDFIAAMGMANGDPAVRAVVLTGAGQRAFSAGQDLAMAATLNAETIGPWFRRLGGLYQSVRDLDKPSVVALNGLAAGFGFQTALHADVRVGHPGVRMSQPEVQAGIPSIVGMWIMKEVIGLARAIEMSLTCRFLGAEDCLDWGLIDHLVPADQVMAKALEIARALAAKPALAMRLSKERMRRLTQPGYDATIEAAVAIQREAFQTGEPQRVAEAFLAERARRKSPERA
jgi:enoyl-CoA hydratase